MNTSRLVSSRPVYAGFRPSLGQRFSRLGAPSAALLLGLLSPLSLQATGLTASDGADYDYFGRSVSVSGTVGLIGADNDDENNAFNSGSAYLFRGLDTATGSVTQTAKLTASDGASNDRFGNSVSVSGTVGLIGAYGDASGSGSAYLFRGLDTATGSVTQTAKLTASDGVSSDQFGYSVSVSGTVGLIGAYGDSQAFATNKGSAYLFRGLDTVTGSVTQTAKLTASDGATDDYFGNSVSVSGTVGLIGAYGDASNSGSAYLFRGLDKVTGSVTQTAKLTASDGASSDRFWLFGERVRNRWPDRCVSG
jgi:hypothetical protein